MGLLVEGTVRSWLIHLFAQAELRLGSGIALNPLVDTISASLLRSMILIIIIVPSLKAFFICSSVSPFWNWLKLGSFYISWMQVSNSSIACGHLLSVACYTWWSVIFLAGLFTSRRRLSYSSHSVGCAAFSSVISLRSSIRRLRITPRPHSNNSTVLAGGFPVWRAREHAPVAKPEKRETTYCWSCKLKVLLCMDVKKLRWFCGSKADRISALGTRHHVNGLIQAIGQADYERLRRGVKLVQTFYSQTPNFYIILDKFKLQRSDWPSFKVSLAMRCRQGCYLTWLNHQIFTRLYGPI